MPHVYQLTAQDAALLPILWRRFSLRHWSSEPGQTLLLLALLSVGVAVFMSIRLANRAAVAGFEQFTYIVASGSDYTITAASGWVPESWLVEIRQDLGREPVNLIPVLEVSAARPRRAGEAFVGREAFRLVGFDLVAAANLLSGGRTDGAFFRRDETARGGAQPTLREALSETDSAWITPALAERDGLRPGDGLDLVLDDSVVRLRVAGTIPLLRDAPALEPALIIMDLPALQRVSSRPKQLSRIEVVLPAGAEMASRRTLLGERLERAANGRWLVESPASRRAAGETMTAAFRLNLTVLSLIALLVGLLLVVQALDGAVVRRRQEIAILRSLGVGAGTIRMSWLAEAAVLGLAAGLLGSLLGWAGAQATVRFVGRTVNALYHGNTVAAASIHGYEIVGGMMLGLCASLLAGWIPARAAAVTPPAQLLSRGHIPSGLRFLSRKRPALAILGMGVGLMLLPPLELAGSVSFPLGGYGAALCWILGAGMLAGALFKPLGIAMRTLASRLVPARIVTGHLLHPAGRNRLAVAGLVAAVGMSAGMLVLVASFETTVRGWIERNLTGDLFVASDGAQNASSTSRIQPDTWRALARDPDVAGVELYQRASIHIDGLQTFLAGVGTIGGVVPAQIPWIDDPDVSVAAFAATPGVAYVSESFSERFRLRRGESVAVPTPAGTQHLMIAGVFADYGNERGSILVPMGRFSDWFHTEAVLNLSAHLRAGVRVETVRDRWQQSFPGLRVLTNENLRGEILRIFRQTFSITYALELIGVLVAVVGLALTLASMLLDRREELATLRALGCTHREIAAAAGWEGAAIALVGSITGIGLSLALGYLLVFVINKQSFGWTLQFVVPAFLLAALVLLVVASGGAVAWVVGRWAANLRSDREE